MKADGTVYTTARGKRYEKYIASPEWAQKRKEYWAEYGRSCKVSGCDGQDLHVHHHTYIRLGDERLTDLVGLCQRHHEEVHSRHDAGKRKKSLTRVTEEVTGLKLRNVTEAKKVKKVRKQSVKTKKKTLAELEQSHRGKLPKTKCACRWCQEQRELRKPGRGVGFFDTEGRRQAQPRGTVSARLRKERVRQEKNVQRKEAARMADRRVATTRAHSKAQEVARRITAARQLNK